MCVYVKREMLPFLSTSWITEPLASYVLVVAVAEQLVPSGPLTAELNPFSQNTGSGFNRVMESDSGEFVSPYVITDFEPGLPVPDLGLYG